MSLPFDSIPGPRPLPIIGNTWRYFPIIGDYDPNNLFENAKINRRCYGSIVREKISDKLTILHLFDPDDIKELKDQDGTYPQRRSHRALKKYRNEHPDLYKDAGLFPENGKNWLRQRHLFKRLTFPSDVSFNIEKLERASMKTLRFDHSEKVGNFEDILYKWALGNTLTLFLNTDIDQLDNKLVDELIRQLHNSLDAVNITETQTDSWIQVGELCPPYKMLVDSQKFLHNFVTDRIENYKEAARQPGTYLDNWLHAENLDRCDIISFIIDTLMAGLHTTSYVMAQLLYYISRDEKILERLREEINFYVPLGSVMTADGIDRLELLNNCLTETMRIDPVSIGTGRITSKEIILRGTTIPKHTMIIAQTQAISRDSNIFEEPDTFKPDRWTQYAKCPVAERPSPFASLPFGFGARSCIGQRLAKLQMKISAARFFQQYNITFLESIKTRTTMIHRLEDNLMVHIDAYLNT